MRLASTTALLCIIVGGCSLRADSASKRAIDGETAYKDHCTRCHVSIHTYSPRVMQTFVNHMRVRANLTKGEADAIARYLVGTKGN